MKVLLLTDKPNLLAPALNDSGDEYEVSLATPDIWPKDIDYIVSFGYRHIIKAPELDRFRNRILNVHISLLPWNRGADPNFWSWFDKTPKGVSFHLIEAGLDTGSIVEQGQLHYDVTSQDTLRTTYNDLTTFASGVFRLRWPSWRREIYDFLPRIGDGSFHKSVDKDPWMAKLPLGWDTPVFEVEKLGEEHAKAKQNGSEVQPRPQ